MNINELTDQIRAAIFNVHRTLGPGLLESVYEAALTHAFMKSGMRIKTQLGLPVVFEDVLLESGFRIDILAEDAVIIEIKSVEILHDVHRKQLLTYLRLSDKKIGRLVNFNSCSITSKESLIRIIN